MTVTRLIARPMLASMFVVGGINALQNAPALGAKAAKVTDRVVPAARKLAPSAPIPDNPVTLVRINAVTQIVAAGHRFWEESEPQARAQQRLHFFKNVSMLGGLLLAGVDTEGKPGVAWRARRAARDVRREGRQLAKQARLEARVAKAHLT